VAALVFIIILAIIAIGGLGYGTSAKEGVAVLVGGVAAVLFIIVALVSCTQQVGTSDVGVETAFGSTQGDLTPGLHVVAPWISVTTWDGSIQTITYGRDLDQSHPDHCLQVKIGGLQTACVAGTFQYQLRAGAADNMFRLYRTQPNMNEFLVRRSFDQAVNSVLGNYNPIEAVAAGAKVGTALSPFANRVSAVMRQDIGADIKVKTVFLPYIAFDQSLTGRLNAFQAARADTLIAVQHEQTATAQATANNDLAKSVNNINVIAQECVTNVLEPLVKEGKNPAGVSCTGVSGGGSTVVVPAGK
jgi:regulator of protease activity HflC (stomatin/prohibitin superfamily)